MSVEIKENSYTRIFTEADHSMLSEWWKDHGWPTIPLSFLPKLGIVVYVNFIPCAIGFLYTTNSDIAIMEWIVTNKKASAFDRSSALDTLIEELTHRAKEAGFKAVMTFLRHPRLMDRVAGHGFLKTDEGMTHYLKHLGEI